MLILTCQSNLDIKTTSRNLSLQFTMDFYPHPKLVRIWIRYNMPTNWFVQEPLPDCTALINVFFLASVFNDALSKPRLVNRLDFMDGRTTIFFARPRCGNGQKIEFKSTWQFDWGCDLVSYFVIVQDTIKHFIRNSYDKVDDTGNYVRKLDEPTNHESSKWLVCPCNFSQELHNQLLKDGICTLLRIFWNYLTCHT